MIPKPARAKHIKVLEGLLKLPENKECADCKSKAPRWASINIGIFICLQCSGIHRSLGVHISKVRSTTLDTWLPEQVAFMHSMGNDRSNAHWEAELPLHYDRGQIENFIHAKYVEKRWIPRDCKVKPPSISKLELAPSRSIRRFGGIAEWTNSQHLCKGRRDGSASERNRAASSSGIGEECLGSENKHQQQEKKESYQPSINQSASVVKISNVEPSKEPAQVACSVLPNGSVSKPEQEVLKIKSATTKTMPAVPSPEVNCAAEYFVSLSIDNSLDNGSSLPDTSAWVHFDSDQESSTPEAKIVPNSTVANVLVQEAKLMIKSSSSKVNPELTVEGAQTATIPPLTNGQFGGHHKYVTNNNQSLSEKPIMVSASSIHLQRLALLAQGLSSTDAPTSAGSIHQLNINGGSVEHSSGTQIPMQTSQPMMLATNSVRYINTLSSLYKPGIQLRSMSTTSARKASAALPVSGYDYDFSFLTQGMFTKQ